jgi:hypothetical protein
LIIYNNAKNSSKKGNLTDFDLLVHLFSDLDDQMGLGLVPAGRAQLPVRQPVPVQVVVAN